MVATTVSINASATVLRPGDKVLITMTEPDLDPVTLCAVQEELGNRFPGVEFTVVAGASSVVVQHEECGE